MGDKFLRVFKWEIEEIWGFFLLYTWKFFLLKNYQTRACEKKSRQSAFSNFRAHSSLIEIFFNSKFYFNFLLRVCCRVCEKILMGKNGERNKKRKSLRENLTKFSWKLRNFPKKILKKFKKKRWKIFKKKILTKSFKKFFRKNCEKLFRKKFKNN